MKSLVILLSLPVLFLVSCQPTQVRQEPLPPVFKPTPVTTPPKPKPVSTVENEKPLENELRPLTPDPRNTNPSRQIPRFQVPDNIQPKVPDGINQAEFLELKWTR